jgi:hypothetical protein
MEAAFLQLPLMLQQPLFPWGAVCGTTSGSQAARSELLVRIEVAGHVQQNILVGLEDPTAVPRAEVAPERQRSEVRRPRDRGPCAADVIIVLPYGLLRGKVNEQPAVG